MATLSIGDSVRFKAGVKDSDFDGDMSGWQGHNLAPWADEI